MSSIRIILEIHPKFFKNVLRFIVCTSLELSSQLPAGTPLGIFLDFYSFCKTFSGYFVDSRMDFYPCIFFFFFNFCRNSNRDSFRNFHLVPSWSLKKSQTIYLETRPRVPTAILSESSTGILFEKFF